MVRLTDRPDMTLDVYRGRKTITQHLTASSLISIRHNHVAHLKIPEIANITVESDKTSHNDIYTVYPVVFEFLT